MDENGVLLNEAYRPFRGIRSSAGIFSPGQEALARKWIRRCYFFGAAAVCLIGLLECVFYFVVQKLGFLMGSPPDILFKIYPGALCPERSGGCGLRRFSAKGADPVGKGLRRIP